MDLITGLLLLWGVGKTQVGPSVAPPMVRTPPAWPTPAPALPARPVKRQPVRRVVKPARPRRIVRRVVPAPVPGVPAPVAPPPAMPVAVAPAAPPPPVYTTLPVSGAQSLLNSLGANLKHDGLFGPKTAAAWKKAALARDLPAHIVRMAPQVVQVTTYTLDRLRAASGGVAGPYIP